MKAGFGQAQVDVEACCILSDDIISKGNATLVLHS